LCPNLSQRKGAVFILFLPFSKKKDEKG